MKSAHQNDLKTPKHIHLKCKKNIQISAKNRWDRNVGQPVAENLIRLDCPSPSSYVLVSNMYAGLGKWNEVRKVRAMMKGKNLKKIPGCSWIELEGLVHAFFVQDKSHPEITEIHSILDSL